MRNIDRVCLAALQRAPLTGRMTRYGRSNTLTWMHKRRAFSPHTVNRLIAAGYARREGWLVKEA